MSEWTCIKETDHFLLLEKEGWVIETRAGHLFHDGDHGRVPVALEDGECPMCGEAIPEEIVTIISAYAPVEEVAEEKKRYAR